MEGPLSTPYMIWFFTLSAIRGLRGGIMDPVYLTSLGLSDLQSCFYLLDITEKLWQINYNLKKTSSKSTWIHDYNQLGLIAITFNFSYLKTRWHITTSSYLRKSKIFLSFKHDMNYKIHWLSKYLSWNLQFLSSYYSL